VAVDQLSSTFAALADPTRREILAQLAVGEATVNELAGRFPITVQAVSKHLKVLERAGLITRGRTGQLRPSRLQGAPLRDAVDWLEKYRRFWEESFDYLDERLQAIQNGPEMAELAPPHGAPEAGITITRLFDAPRERVWEEWTEPERFADWFGGPGSEVPLATVSMDVRPGGAWRATMFAGPEGREIHWEGEYREVIEPQRLVFTLSDQPGADEYELVTVVLTDLGDGRTEMVFQQRGRMTPEQYGRAGEGWSAFFDRIAERIAEA
jgi:uncharacterized protein YndB with AHSA1/START domain/DNA-binding transcriptional ArsR family regulator